VNSLPNDSSSRVIFIYPGTYSGQVYITRSGPLTVRLCRPYGVNILIEWYLDLRLHNRHDHL
jgi:hypothetical protein